MLGASSTNCARGRAVRRLCAPAAGVTKKVMNVSACLAAASTGRWVGAGRRRSACTPARQAGGTSPTKVAGRGPAGVWGGWGGGGGGAWGAAARAGGGPTVVHGAAPVHAGHAAARQLVQQAVH